jgi:hypothetical protein
MSEESYEMGERGRGEIGEIRKEVWDTKWLSCWRLGFYRLEIG